MSVPRSDTEDGFTRQDAGGVDGGWDQAVGAGGVVADLAVGVLSPAVGLVVGGNNAGMSVPRSDTEDGFTG